MTKKRIGIIVLTIALVAALTVGVSWAIWGDSVGEETDIDNASGSWNESAKYIKYEPVYTAESTQIGWRVTGYTGTVTKLTIPERKDNFPVIEISSSLNNNDLVTEVIIPKSITKIADNAFVRFNRMTKFTVTAGATFTIGEYSFNGCTNLVTFSYAGSTVTSIGAMAFVGCIALDAKPST